MYFKKEWLLLCALLLLLCPAGKVSAEEADYTTTQYQVEGFGDGGSLSDANRGTYTAVAEETGKVVVSREDGISALYIEFDRVPTVWSLTNVATGEVVECGTNAFLHEYVDVVGLFTELPLSLELSFAKGIVISDVYAFSSGDMPSFVQMWNPPCEEADLLLFSTHSDDEQLFFAGMLPYYAIERGYNVQVAYVVQHFEAQGAKNHVRPHEQLDGLWVVGVRNYPVISEFPDLYAESKDRETALNQAITAFKGAGYSYDNFVDYITTCIRRFKPLVIVSHDLNGEYGHGAHVLAAQALTEAVEAAKDETLYPESAATYGTWDTEKLYLHLYEENPIIMDYDTPLESLGGKTPFEVSREGFNCHKSQHWTWFYRWIYGTADAPVNRATDIATYSPLHFGLYRTTVGADVNGGDFFENVTSYGERKEAARLEAERLEAERLEAERLEAERLEAERLEAERLETERLEQEKENSKDLSDKTSEAMKEALERMEALKEKREVVAMAAMVALVVILIALMLYYVRNKGKKHRK